MASRSAADADHALLDGNPLKGGGPLNSNESTYKGDGFLVDLAGRRLKCPATSVGSSSKRSSGTIGPAVDGVMCRVGDKPV